MRLPFWLRLLSVTAALVLAARSVAPAVDAALDHRTDTQVAAVAMTLEGLSSTTKPAERVADPIAAFARGRSGAAHPPCDALIAGGTPASSSGRARVLALAPKTSPPAER